MVNYNHTICAIASGAGAIGIVRITGEESFRIVGALVKNQMAYKNIEPRKMLYTEIVGFDNSVIDEVLLVKFEAPHSFTGEHMVEIYCHASPFIQQKILTSLVHYGAKLAIAGEFSQRAFLNGKMDLSQAEAVADLIASGTAESHRIAIAQLKGNVSTKIGDLRDKMLQLTSLLELELDFSEEDVEFVDRTKLNGLIDEICSEIQNLVKTFDYGNAVKSGLPVAIVGEPNVGKSTLLNALLNEERAIVSAIAGTTRDTIEEEFVIDGIKFRLIDTAGIRQADNEVEQLGIERTFKKLKTAQIVILLLDSLAEKAHNQAIIARVKDEISVDTHLIVAYNKSDICQNSQIIQKNTLHISALNNTNVDQLCNRLVDYVNSLKPERSDVIITNVRHVTSLKACQTLLLAAKKAITENLATDFVAQDLREANLYLGEILGLSISADEVLGNIFSKFCIGK